jgi:hypothetical protein
MVISNSTNVNARKDLIEYAMRRMSMACHRGLFFAKHFFWILPAGAMRYRSDRQEIGARRLRRFIVHHL